MRQRAHTFSFAARFLPRERRPAVAALYRFARRMDDLFDERSPERSADAVAGELAAWRDWLASGYRQPAPEPALAGATRAALDAHGVPVDYLLLLLDGVGSDLVWQPSASWSELRCYCFRVASSIGLAMCHVLGAGDDPVALRAAAELGIGMQLTNILRDLGADLDQGRVYLPLDELARHGYSPSRLTRLAARARADGSAALDIPFRDLLRAQVARARAHYDRGLAGVWRLPPPSRLSIMVAGRLYRSILDVIEASDYDVFRRRAATSRWQKAGGAATSWLRLQRGPDRTLTPAADGVRGFQLADWHTPWPG
jgi:15-cis-phytoene synthase